MLSFIASQEPISRWKGVKNFHVNFFFAPDHSKIDGSAFGFYIINKGITPQDFCYILNERGKVVKIFDFFTKGCRVMQPMQGEHFYIYMTPSLIKILNKSESLFLINNIHKKRQFASKKVIQQVLKEYQDHIDKSS